MTQFCPKEHDTFIFGRTKRGTCRRCASIGNTFRNKTRYRLQRNTRDRIRLSEFQDKLAKIKNVPCIDCGKTDIPELMDFDHLFNKHFQISQAYHIAWQRVLLEIAKCEIVCVRCHRIRTYRRMVSKAV